MVGKLRTAALSSVYSIDIVFVMGGEENQKKPLRKPCAGTKTEFKVGYRWGFHLICSPLGHGPPTPAQAHFLPGTWLSSGLGILLATRADLFYIAQSPQLPVKVTGVDAGVLQLSGKPGYLVNLVRWLHCWEGLRDHLESGLPLVDDSLRKTRIVLLQQLASWVAPGADILESLPKVLLNSGKSDTSSSASSG